MYIYKIFHNNTLLYIGSTKNNYICRLHAHKTNIQKHSKSSKFYTYLHERRITYDDLYIQVINTDIKTSDHLFFYESSLIHSNKPLCNVSCINAIPEYRQPSYYTPVHHTSVKHIYPKKLLNTVTAALLTYILHPNTTQAYILFCFYYNALPATTIRPRGRPKTK